MNFNNIQFDDFLGHSYINEERTNPDKDGVNLHPINCPNCNIKLKDPWGEQNQRFVIKTNNKICLQCGFETKNLIKEPNSFIRAVMLNRIFEMLYCPYCDEELNAIEPAPYLTSSRKTKECKSCNMNFTKQGLSITFNKIFDDKTIYVYGTYHQHKNNWSIVIEPVRMKKTLETISDIKIYDEKKIQKFVMLK